MSYIELNLMQSGSRDFAYTCRETSRILVTPSLTPILVIPGPTYWWYFYEWLNLRIGLYPAQKGTRIDNSKAFQSIYWNTDGISNNYCETGPSRRLQIPILILLSDERWWLDSEESDFGHDNSVRNRCTVVFTGQLRVADEPCAVPIINSQSRAKTLLWSLAVQPLRPMMNANSTLMDRRLNTEKCVTIW